MRSTVQLDSVIKKKFDDWCEKNDKKVAKTIESALAEIISGSIFFSGSAIIVVDK